MADWSFGAYLEQDVFGLSFQEGLSTAESAYGLVVVANNGFATRNLFALLLRICRFIAICFKLCIICKCLLSVFATAQKLTPHSY